MKVTVSKEKQKERLKICKNCEFRSNKFLAIFNYDSCKICQCNLKAKSIMRKEWGGKCPMGKW